MFRLVLRLNIGDEVLKGEAEGAFMGDDFEKLSTVVATERGMADNQGLAP
jgi:hypothetical protein